MSYCFIFDFKPCFGKLAKESDIRHIKPDEISRLKPREINHFKGIVVLCELSIDSDGKSVNPSKLHGIKLIQDLRKIGVVVPVIFTSFLSREYIWNSSPLAEIINAIGHDFIQMPVHPVNYLNLINDKRKLTPTELKDIQLFSCEPSGLVRSKTHQVPVVADKLKSGQISPDKAKKELEQCIKDIHSAFQVDNLDLLDYFNKEFPVITNENINEALIFIKNTGEKIINDYSEKDDIGTINESAHKDWMVLMLDDELDESSRIVKILNEKGVSVICKNNADDAMKILDEDDSLRGKISVLLTDYRLNELRNGMLMQQKTQGYTFLQNVGERFHSKLLSAVVYSGLPRRFLLDTFRTYKIRTEPFSKIDFGLTDQRALNFMASRIVEIGDSNYEALLSLPLSNNGWKSHLHKWYLRFRASNDYELKERNISEACSEWIWAFRQGEKPPTPMVKGEMISQDDKKAEKNMARFEAFFRTRRIAQYLYIYYQNRELQSNQNSLDRVYELIRPESRKSDTTTSRKRFLSTLLGLSLTEFPFGATIEELCWFHYDMGIEVLGDFRSFRNRLNKTEEYASELITGNNFLKDLISENNYSIISEKYKISKKVQEIPPKHELFFNCDSFRPYLFDRMDYGVLIQWLEKVFTGRSKEEMELYLEFCDQILKIWEWKPKIQE